MSQLVTIAQTALFFLETIAWLAVAYVAFVAVGGGLGSWLAALGALAAVIVLWVLFASPKGFLTSRVSVIVVRALVYLTAVIGLIAVGQLWFGIALGVLLIACEGLLIWRRQHEAFAATERSGRH